MGDGDPAKDGQGMKLGTLNKIASEKKKNKKMLAAAHMQIDEISEIAATSSEDEEMVTPDKKKKKHKKQSKASDSDDEDSEEDVVSSKKAKKHRKSSKTTDDEEMEIDAEVGVKSKKKKKKKRADTEDEETPAKKSKKHMKRADSEEDELPAKKSKKEKKPVSDTESSASDDETATKKRKITKAASSSEESESDDTSGSESSDGDVKKVKKTKSDSESESDSESDSDSDRSDVDLKVGGQSHKEVGGFTIIGDAEEANLQRVQRVLPKWLSKPTVIAGDIRNDAIPLETSASRLDADLVQRLRDNGITKLFPVQYKLLPHLLPVNSSISHTRGIRGILPPSDICCSAPTGSGKTLAFVLPIVQILRKRVVPRIRALVVLPIQDLASQVAKVFKTYCLDTNLKVVLMVGQRNLHHEQNSLIKSTPSGYESLADILVVTPGRLIDHIHNTPGFDLTHLRFLVIDEADRMMDEVKHDWLTQVENAVYRGPHTAAEYGSSPSLANSSSSVREQLTSLTLNNIMKQKIPLQKLLFSATLSINPEKLNNMNLFRPKLFTSIIHDKLDDEKSEFIGKYTTPVGLTENLILCMDGQKPLYMLYLMSYLKFRRILCFTNTVDSSHRLYLLLKLSGLNVAELSSLKHSVSRKKVIKKFEADKLDCIVCSDSVARGIDIANVAYVIAYDASPHIKTYIHRVGRTARAGKSGTCVSLLESKELHHFNLMQDLAGKKVKTMKVKFGNVKPFIPMLRTSLKQLENVLKGEKIVNKKS